VSLHILFLQFYSDSTHVKEKEMFWLNILMNEIKQKNFYPSCNYAMNISGGSDDEGDTDV
jgi:hypothetical protein